MPCISVIVPVYQAEKFLRGCVESVLCQTFSDWELLLIDDGCTDHSGAICDAYAASDPRVRAFHKTNGGVSSARNLGLEHACGEYVAFLDSDDAFEPAALETLWNLCRETGADTAGCAHWNTTPEGQRTPELLLPAGVYDEADIRRQILHPLVGQRLAPPLFNGFIWRYLFSAAILRAAEITFEGAYLEDEIFLMEYFCHAKRLAVTEQPLYCYLINPVSVTHRYLRNFPETFRRFMDRKTALVERQGLAAAAPDWKENSNWAGLLIAIGNEFAAGNPASAAEKKQAVKALCAQPDMAQAIRTYLPKGLGRNKQIVADLVRGGHFTLLSLLYRLKNRT